MFRRPKVHSGFYKAWRNNGLDQKVIGKIKQLLTDGSVDTETCQLTLTGSFLPASPQTSVFAQHLA